MSERPEKSDFISLLMGNMNSIYTYIVIMVPHTAEADDIFQETATTLWEKFSDYEPGTDFRAWALAIARFKVLKYFDAQKNKKVLFSSDTLATLSERLAGGEPDEREEIEILRRCVDKLEKRGRELIVMKYTRKISTKELATQLNRSVSGLYDTLSRIHASLVDCVRRNLAAQERL
jgi:RNA polymerase sigma-70 factor (ECF subfamily)